MRGYILSIVLMMMSSCKRGSSFTRAILPTSKTILRAERRKLPTIHRRQVVSRVATSSPDGGLLVEPKDEFCPADEILEPKGKHYGWYSLGPFKEGMKWAATPGPYFKNMTAQNDNDPVFKIHPGLAAIAITDHASGKWFFDQPDTVLDRQDGAYFGAMKCSQDYLGDSLPALVTNLKEAHPAVREYMLTMVRERLGSAETAILHAADKFYSDKRTNGIGKYNGVYDFFLQQTYQFVLEFMFGTGEEGGQPLPPFEDFRRANPLNVSPLIELDFDTPVANAAVKLLQRMKGGVTSEEKASIEVLLDSIRSSKMWPKYLEILEEQKVFPS